MSAWRWLSMMGLAACTGPEPVDTAEEQPKVPEFGFADARQLTLVGDQADGLDTPRDLAFDPEATEVLWTVNQDIDGTVIYFDPGTEQQDSEVRVDVYGGHFMAEVSAIAFGAPGTFATCQETDNNHNGSPLFMGPTLWSSDLEVYAEVNQNNSLLGSHLDMQHESPFCMGIAWDHDNVYWAFDGYNGEIVRYDFAEDHGPGYDDHSDGIVRRYRDAQVERVEDVPSHLVLDPDTGWLYVADTANGRVMRLDTNTGEIGDDLREEMEYLEEYSEVNDAVFEEFASGLDEPSGIAIADGRLFVSDYGNGEIVAFDFEGNELDRMQSEADGIMGITVGPDGKLWFVDGEDNQMIRVDPE